MDHLSCHIPANPDISGIGVRASIYAQAALVSIIFVVAFADGKFDKRESRTLKEVHENQLVTSCALLASALVQLAVGKLSVFHTLLVLYLSWINIFGTLTFVTIDMIIDDIDVWGGSNPKVKKHYPILPENWHGALVWIIVSTYMTTVCALGLWVWIDLSKQMSSEACPAGVIFSLAGHRIVLPNEALRISSICFYGLFVFPVLNIFIYWALAVPLCFGLVSACRWIYSLRNMEIGRRADNILLSYGVFTCSLILQIIVIVDIEVMIHKNRPFIGNEDSDWSFGQTLSLFLLVSPLLATTRMVLLKFSGKKEKDMSDQRENGSGKVRTDGEVHSGSVVNNGRDNNTMQSPGVGEGRFRIQRGMEGIKSIGPHGIDAGANGNRTPSRNLESEIRARLLKSLPIARSQSC